MSAPSTREQVYQALRAACESTAKFTLVTREMYDPEGLTAAQSPALALICEGESYTRQGQLPNPVRVLHYSAVFYVAVGDALNAQAPATINAIMDALDAAFKTDVLTGRCTLGGVVQHAMIDGEPKYSFGVLEGKSFAIVPIKLTLP